jgi:hypothetical protein
MGVEEFAILGLVNIFRNVSVKRCDGVEKISVRKRLEKVKCLDGWSDGTERIEICQHDDSPFGSTFHT